MCIPNCLRCRLLSNSGKGVSNAVSQSNRTGRHYLESWQNGIHSFKTTVQKSVLNHQLFLFPPEITTFEEGRRKYQPIYDHNNHEVSSKKNPKVIKPFIPNKNENQ